MKENNSKVNVLLKKIVTRIADHEADGWPPECALIMYQPVRPTEVSDITEHDSKVSNKA